MIILNKWLIKSIQKNFRAQWLKTNKVVNQRIVKTLIIKYGIYANILAENICE